MADLGMMFRVKDHLHAVDPYSQFRDAMASHGLYPDQIQENKNFYRFSTNNKKHNKNGYYYFETSGDIGFGCFGDWSRDLHVKWSSFNDQELPIADRLQLQKKVKVLAEKQEHERAEKYQKAQKQAEADLAAAKPVSSHKYLDKKNVTPQNDFKVNVSGELLIPVYDFNQVVTSYQRITKDGQKRFLYGGRVSGGMYSIAGSADDISICEGVATGLTINQATGYTVVCAFNVGNLMAVAKTIRENSNGKIIICADNDEKTSGNPGLTKGREVAKEIEALCVYPVFTTGEGTDFNDLAEALGIEEVREQIVQISSDGPVDISSANIVDIERYISEEPPKRSWLIDGLIPSGKVGAIVGAGGTGKSNFALLIARVMASGWELAGLTAKDQKKVMIINVEDEEDDIWRRLDAQKTHYPLKQGELYYLKKNLIIYPGVGIVRPFMKTEGSNPVITKWAAWLDRGIGNIKPDCVILDTRSRLYGLDENNNDHAAQWIGMLESFVRNYGCSFIVIHHVSKAAIGSHGQGASRGASAFVDNCRFIISLAGMEKSTAQNYGLVGSEWKYFSMTMSKSNYAEGFKPIWFEKHEEGVPVLVDLDVMRGNCIRDVIVKWFRTTEEQLTRRDATKGPEGKELREHVKEKIGLTRDDLAQWINRLLVEGKLTEEKVDFEGAGRPRKILSLSDD